MTVGAIEATTVQSPESSAAPDERRLSIAFFGIVVQVLVLVGLARALRIENPAFHDRLLPYLAVGFVLHHLLPARYRLPAFAVMSVGSIGLVFGIASGTWLLVIGFTLLGLCHLPVRWTVRIGLILGAAVVLVALRAGVLPAPWSAAIWPILGSMFMYRLIVYLYDLRHQTTRSDPARSIAYFFMMPNVVFPLFPVVDFATFRRTYYDRPAGQIYQQGVLWIVRGFTHLVLYRLIYQYAVISPAEVSTTVDLVRYLLANFGLYLRVSGQFHLIVGLLHLFGFRLPETHRFFYLASSFTDFWRRINIYWKDFVQKLVFNPTFYRLRRVDETTALVLGTLAVFAATWLLHSYQWFWILGTWLLSWTDTAFWGILGIVLVFGAVLEMRRGRTRSLGTQQLAGWPAIKLAARTSLTFSVICVLWGLWTSPTFADFRALFSVLTWRAIDILAVVAVPIVVGTAAVFAARYRSGVPKPAHWRPVAISMMPLLVLWGVTEQPVVTRLGVDVAAFLQSARSADLSRRDAERLQRGYYEQLVGVNRFNGQLWEVFAPREDATAQGPLRAGDLLPYVRQRNDALHTELVPNFRSDSGGIRFTTNRWAMRDQTYEQVTPAGRLRIAVLGQSYVAGAGVPDSTVFESVVEGRFAESAGDDSARAVEFLNFAVPGYSVVQQYLLLEERVAVFSPDAILLVGHPIDLMFTTRWMLFEVKRLGSLALMPDYIAQRVRAAGIAVDMSFAEMEKRLRPYREDVMRWTLSSMVAWCKQRGVTPLYAFIPTPMVRFGRGDAQTIVRIAREAGFDVMDLSTVYDGHDQTRLIQSDADRHPNVEGHRVIATRLHEVLSPRLPAIGSPSR